MLVLDATHNDLPAPARAPRRRSTMTTADPELSAFCRDVWPQLVGGLALQCGDRMVAEELAQDALVKLCQHWTRLDPLKARGWVWTVAQNGWRSVLRRKAAERRARVRSGPEQCSTEEATAEALAVRSAVAALPGRQREAVVLRYFVGLSVDETALAMRCADGTVRAHTHRAIAALRRQLGDEVVTTPATPDDAPLEV